MAIEQLPHSADSPASIIFESEARTVASYERELKGHRQTENELRATLAREDALLHQKEELIELQEILTKESDHRLLNNLQMIVSLLSLQSRASTNPEVAAQLATASDRVATIGRIHRRLHSLDGAQSFTLKQYLEDLCRDFSIMLAAGRDERVITVEGIEVTLPAATAIPLGFIANELITNAAKYGKGRITVSLEADPANGYALSVANDGPALPEGFDPAASKGLGMSIVRSLIGRIGGEFQIGRGDNSQGPRFTVLFC
jgi:two-component system, sensor histidine kinase PdtaS